jgi:hypothetical protein
VTPNSEAGKLTAVRTYTYFPVLTRQVAQAPAVIGAIDAGECDAPFRITWPSEVDVFKSRVLAALESRELSVRACAALPAEEVKAWDAFVGPVRAFLKTPTPTFGSYGEWVSTCAHSRELDAWDKKLTKYGCKIFGAQDVSSGDSKNTLKWAATAAVAVAVAAVAITYAPTIMAFLPTRKG